MMKRMRIYLLTILALGSLSCSKQKNPLAEISKMHPKLITIKNSSLIEYSYNFEGEIKNYRLNDVLTLGSFNDNRSIALIKFSNTSFPKKGYVLDSDGKLELTLNKFYSPENEEIPVKIGLIKEAWKSDYVTWNNSDNKNKWNSSWSDMSTITPLEIESIISKKDSTLTFTFSKDTMTEIIEGHLGSSPSIQGFALYTDLEQDHYIELKSQNVKEGYPTLSYNYYPKESDTKTKSAALKLIASSTIHSKEVTEGHYLNDKIKLSNIAPIRSVLKLQYPIDSFGEHSNLKRITVNKAELILFPNKEEGASHIYNGIFQITPYILNKEYKPEDKDSLPIKEQDIKLIKPYFTKSFGTEADSVVINITSIVQQHLSGEEENYGILLASFNENKSNGYVEFYQATAEEPDKSPYLKIIYSFADIDD
ncbi:MAG: hypothetical protein WC327_05205 [Candidatus Cloacimonadia bacterium]